MSLIPLVVAQHPEALAVADSALRSGAITPQDLAGAALGAPTVGLVIDAVSPAAGTEVDRDSSVVVRVSEGPENVKVPEDIVGQSLEYARESIQHAGLTVGPVSTVNSATVPANAVISSDPAPGSSVARDSAVKLQVSSGKVTVPDVVGRSRADAESALRSEDVRLNSNVRYDGPGGEAELTARGAPFGPLD